MYRRFIATITAASIAITAFGAAPALADENKLAKALAVVVGVAVVGNLIQGQNRQRGHAVARHGQRPLHQSAGRSVYRQKVHAQPRYPVHAQPRYRVHAQPGYQRHAQPGYEPHRRLRH